MCRTWRQTLRRTMESIQATVLSSGIKTHGRRMFFYKLIPSVFHQTCLDIHPKIPLKCDFSIWAGPNPLTFLSANFQIKLAPLILYKLIYTSTFKSTVKDISNFRYSNRKIITLVCNIYWNFSIWSHKNLTTAIDIAVHLIKKNHNYCFNYLH